MLSQQKQEMDRIRREIEQGKKEMKDNEKAIKLVANVVVYGMILPLCLCVVGAAVGGVWWILTGKPMFGG